MRFLLHRTATWAGLLTIVVSAIIVAHNAHAQA